MAMIQDIVVSCNSREEYDALMEWAEERGCIWSGGTKLTEVCRYQEAIGGWGILFLKRGEVQHSRSNYFRDNKEYGPVVEFDDFAYEYGILAQWENFF